MAQNFLACDRDQELLLPPSIREWLPEDHFAWFVLAAVEEMDLAVFYSAYRADGHLEDVACRVIAANQVPDHCTIARFRQRHEDALAGLFGEVLGLCAKAGLVQPEVVAVDGTKVHANASQHANRDYEQLAREALQEAAETDRLEDEQFGERRGDELPSELSTAQGRRGWLREAKRQLEQERAQEARPIPAARPARVREAKRRLEEELLVETRANTAYEAYRARGRMSDGRRS